MFRTLTARLLIILTVVGLSGWTLLDNHRNEGTPVRLGLDLRGGIHLVLEVDDPEGTLSPEDRAGAIERSQRIIRNRVDELGVTEPIIQIVGRDRLIVELAGVPDEERARELIGRTAVLEWRLVRPLSAVGPALERIDRAVLAEASLPPGETEPRPFTALLWEGTDEGEYLVADADVPAVRQFLDLPGVQSGMPRNLSFRWSWEPVVLGGRTFRQLYLVDRDPFMTGDMLQDARADRDPEFNQALVHFELSRAGGRIFSNMTGRHIGDRLAILLDGEVVSAPVVEARIGSRGVIQLNRAAMDEARDLALVLRAGALPAPLRIMEERAVGPSLGRDSIRQGSVAGIVGLALVVLAMVAYYRMSGVLAVGALAVYVVLLLGGLAAIDATLTLPGLAGIVLSIGMAVDANVLIFERIREELDGGRTPGAAVDEGFSRALSAIVDANITTLITALVLFYVGTGPVRGFAVTLSIGIVASFFTALYVTRTLFLLRLAGPWSRS
jgi:protein-export membrane protein SecD